MNPRRIVTYRNQTAQPDTEYVNEILRGMQDCRDRPLSVSISDSTLGSYITILFENLEGLE